ncbi:ROK family protein [Chloroflexota bacterium]
MTPWTLGRHHVIDPSGLVCYCGSHGCWESLASGAAISRRAQEFKSLGGATIPTPRARGIGVPIAELLPLQLLSVQTAIRLGHVPAEFKIIGKVTLKE